MTAYRVELPVFEGPMDLLLYLIKKNELDIYDIPVSKVTEQYLAYLDLLKSMNVRIASQFLVMAATLMFIKSKMLLPASEEEENAEPGDPRTPLVEQLLEYQQFKEIALSLEARATAEENVFSRWIPLELLEQEPYEEHEDYDLFLLFKYFSELMADARDSTVEIARAEVNVEDMREELIVKLKKDSKLLFHEFVRGRSVQELVAIFLAVLELLKRRQVRVIQPDAFGPIEIRNRS